MPVGPLSAGALHRVLRDRLGRSFARQTLLRIHERSGGNPFFALELARALEADVDPLQPLPVPETLDELVRARVFALPERTREALALVAALGAPSEALLERAGVGADALEPAVAARVVERENGTIRFTHPLLSSALYPESSAGRRAFTAGSPASSTTLSSAPVTSRSRRTRRMPVSLVRSTTQRGSRPTAERRRRRPSSPSRRSG